MRGVLSNGPRVVISLLLMFTALILVASQRMSVDAHPPNHRLEVAGAKTETPCDTTLLGVIADPLRGGADGHKTNERYLPLAIYGYFPAKVTMEGGRVRRGDPITSSSTPGQGMKAVQACRIIGYALEDADRDGTIRIFAHLGEHAAPEVQALRAELGEVRAELQQLRRALAR